MGFFQKVKNIFTKPIVAERDVETKLVSMSKKSGSIHLGKSLCVPSGFACVFVCKEKVCDIFREGDYKLSINALPLVVRRTKLNVPNKKGKYKNSFKADVYFVNLNNFVSQKFESVYGIYLKKDKNFLGFTAFVKGYFGYKVSNPELLMETLLKCYGIMRGRVADRQLAIWTGLCVDRKIEKNKPSAEELFERQTTCFDGMIDYLNKNMRDVGIEYTEVNITETIFPKRIYKKVGLSYAEVNKNQPTGYENVIEKVENMNQKLNEINMTEENLVPFENNLIQEKTESNVEHTLKPKTESIDFSQEIQDAKIDNDLLSNNILN
ncbi:MAG: SPFH domain-containing protein, partial [Clostridiales bacterium]|nr:SPFH domain-containing protein [Candidatus Apopatousia equi]